jgi:N-methylhydantoinase B
LGLKKIPNGTYVARDFMDDDGFGNVDIPVCVKIIKHSKGLDIDFSGSSRQVTGGINAVEAITSSATRYVIRCVIEHLLGESLPAGGGSMSAVKMILPNGSIVNANPPASVAAGNVETSQRITDVLLLAFAEALPDLIPALSQGTMNNLTIGGLDPRVDEPFTYYETAGGGMGAGPNRHGLSGVHTHMSNSLNTPIEALEHAYPFQVEHYSIIRESGGKGLFCGGDGLRREIKLLADSEVTLLTERRRRGPLGMHGGEDGSPGKNILTRDGKKKILPAKISFQGRQGDVVGVHTPGAGGWSQATTDGE